MIKTLALAAAIATVASTASAQDPAHHPGEEAVAAYTVSNANAGTTPFEGQAMLQAFHGREGIDRIVDDMLNRSVADPRIGEIFALTDMVQSHADLGLQPADMGALVEHLQQAMDAEGVPFRTQNRFLAKLAPMRRNVVTR